MECILIRGIRVIRGQTTNDPLSQSMVRRECVAGATSERFSLFSIFAHRVLERWGAVDFFHDLAIVAIAFPAFRNRA
jgi:hypothetical protein